ncbi:unnamed protein product [Durusdinium trenchii]|uniref:Cold-shock domain-containing protein n=1 Tax=Durusdinium trenchii TaxID=1381693 RepID=A0ABP0KF00_9DINO
MDLYFHGRDMDEASQGLLMLVGGAGLANCIATCRVEARADGRWNGRNVSLLESGVQMLDGMKMAGMIRYFYDYKGFGFINVTGNPIDIYFQGRDVGPDAQMRCEEMGPVGTVVWFTVYAQTDSRWQAKEIVLAGDGSSPGGLTAEMLGGKGWGKGDGDGWDSYGWDGWGSMDYGGGKGCGKGKSSLPKVEKQIIPGCELVGRLKSYNAEKNFGFISVEGQTNDVYFQVWDLVESLKSQLDSVGPEGSGLTPGALVKFWLQLMPGGGRLRARDLSLSPATAEGPSAAATVDAAVQKAAVVAHEAIIPGTGSILYDGAEVSGKVKTFNQDRGFGFISVDADETDLYFNVKDMHPEDQKKVANGLRLPGQRVWFWAEMLDNGMSGRWRCHDISLSFRRSSPSAAATTDGPPAKRPRTDGPENSSGQKVNGSTHRSCTKNEQNSSSKLRRKPADEVMRTPNLAVVRASSLAAGFGEGSRADDKRSEGPREPWQFLAAGPEEEIARMIENGVPSNEILEAIRSGSEGDQPLEIQGESEEADEPVAKSLSEERPPRRAALSPLGFAKKAVSPTPQVPQLRVKEEEPEEKPEPSAVVPELDPGRIAKGLDEVGIFGGFSKKAEKPSGSEAIPSRVAPYVPLGLPRRSRPLEEAKLEEFRKLATHLFEELVIHEVEMDLVETVSSRDGVIDSALFHRYTDPKSAGTALRRAIVCTEDRQGERRISGDCAVPVKLPPALRGTGAEDLEELEVTLGKERDVAAKYYKDHPIEHVETSPNAVEWGPDSDDSEGDPATMDLEMHHTFVQLASGAGKIHKPSVGDEHMPRCGSQGSRFAELGVDHSWGMNYKLCNKCFGKNAEASTCPLLCDFVLKKGGKVVLRCGRRCRGDQVEGHLNPSEQGFDPASRHRCTLHSEEVLEEDL